MDENFYKKAAILLDEVIEKYTELLEMYKEKKQALIKSDMEMLSFVDKKTIEQIKLIENTNKKMSKFYEDNNSEFLKVSDLMAQTKDSYPELFKIFDEKKVKINEVSSNLAFLERSNVELIQHGLIWSDKLLDIIISAAVPQKDNYDKHGKNIDTSEMGLSSIVEDA